MTVKLNATAGVPDAANHDRHSTDCSDDPKSRLPTEEINQQQVVSSKKRNFDDYIREDSASVTSGDDYLHSLDSDNSSPVTKKPGRRPMPDEECDMDDDEDPKIKRKAQNRAAQRAFRERKERYVKELEKKIKYVQDSHVYATTHLYQENQQLRSIVYRLELEINALKGTPSADMIAQQVDHRSSVTGGEKKAPPHHQSWLASIGPPVPLPVINSFPPTPLAPLQIRPSPITAVSTAAAGTNKRSSLVNEEGNNKSKKSALSKAKPSNTNTNNNSSHKIEIKQLKMNSKTPCPTRIHFDNNQEFTFSISTPATLRANTHDDLSRKSVQIEAVPLYPDHSHPANTSLLDKSTKQHQQQQQEHPHDHGTSTTPILSPAAQYPCSIGSSSAGEEDEDDDVLHANKPASSAQEAQRQDPFLFSNTSNTHDNNDDESLNEILKPFFDTTGNLDLSLFNTTATSSSNDWASTTMENMLQDF